MDRNPEPSSLVSVLEKNAARIEAIGRALRAEQLVASPAPGEWSPNEILWHIRATADVHGEHITRILTEEQPRWRHVSPRARMKKTHYYRLPFAESLEAFTRQRSDLVAQLKSFGAEAWERAALVFVPYDQREWRFTLHKLVLGMAQHEAGHCAEMEAAASALSDPAEP